MINACTTTVCLICGAAMDAMNRSKENPNIHAHCAPVIQCAWCKKVWEGGQWIALSEPLQGVTVSHGICLDCKDVAMAKLDEMRRRN